MSSFANVKSMAMAAAQKIAASQAVQDAYGTVSAAASQAANQAIQNATKQVVSQIPQAKTGGRKSKKSTPPSQCGCSGGTLGGCLTCGGKLGSSSKPKSGGKKKKRSKSRKSRSKSRSRK